jgi:tetratricopeptide (TPR) repeat protein
MAQYQFTRIAIVVMVLGAALHAQPAPEHLRRADEAYRARKADEALVHLLRAITMDPVNYEAHWKASRSEVDLAEGIGRSTNKRLLDAAERHAQEAIRLNPAGADGHFALARALRQRALGTGVRDRARFADAIRSEALAALQADAQHPGALHSLGMWHAELMRINGMSRRFAMWFLGAELLESANWDEAQQLLEDAARVEPGRIVHRLELAGIYADRGDKSRAREIYMRIASAPLVDPNDDLYKRQAADRLERLGS